MDLDLDSSPILSNNCNVPQKKSSFGAILTRQETHRRSNTEWSLGSASDGSLSDAVNNLDQYHHTRERPQEVSDDLVEKLKNEVDSLSRKAAISELELQSLKKQVVKEVKKGNSLSEQLSSLREERDELEEECEGLRSSINNNEEAETASKLRVKYEEIQGEADELRYELDHQKDLNANLRLQLQKTQESTSELILEISDLAAMVKQKEMEISKLSSKIQDHNDLEEVENRKLNEIQIHKKEKKELEIHLEQLAQDYEILKQENEDLSTKLEEMNREDAAIEQMECPRCSENEIYIEKLEDELKRQVQEVSRLLTSINYLENQSKDLHKEIDKQAQGFEEELEAMTQDRIEQEQRAIKAEELLRKTRWKNAVTAERLQEEFKRLSGEMSAKFDENEKLSLQSVEEANELRQQKRTLEEMLQKAKEQMRMVTDQNAVMVRDLTNQLAEREDLQKKCTSARKEAEEAVKELISMRSDEEDKEKIVGNLKSQVESLIAQQNHLQNNLLKEKLDKENLRKKMNTMQGELKRREEDIANAKKASHLCEKKDIVCLKEKVDLLMVRF